MPTQKKQRYKISPTTVLAVAVGVQAILVSILWMTEVGRRDLERAVAEQEFIQMVRSHTLERQVEAVVVPQEERVYLPELKIYAPLTTATRAVRYTPSSYVGEDPSTVIYLSAGPILNSIDSNSEFACFNAVRLQIDSTIEAYDGERHAGTVALDGGWVLQIYENDRQECVSVWPDEYRPSDFTAAFSQAKSY